MRFYAGRRWWWAVGLIALVVVHVGLPSGIAALAMRSHSKEHFDVLEALFPLVMVVLLAPYAWLFIVAPRLDSAHVKFSEARPPRSRRVLLTVLAWAPVFVVIGVCLIVLIDMVTFWWTTGRWDSDDLTDFWFLTVVWLSITATYGFFFSRALRRRVAAAARAANVCFNCAYDLSGHSGGGRCPECGRGIDSAGPTA